jgi:hypothetical protein
LLVARWKAVKTASLSYWPPKADGQLTTTKGRSRPFGRILNERLITASAARKQPFRFPPEMQTFRIAG